MSMSRRKFLGTTAAAGLAATSFSAASYARILGANDRVGLGFMGTRSRGEILLESFINVGGVNVAHICDVDSRVLPVSVEIANKGGHNNVKTTDDVRRVLDNKDVDALVIATPDHWHAPAGVMALQAGKHVYVEKPLSHNPREGEIFVKAQKKYGKVVQMGNQQRSSAESQELVAMIRNGDLGRIYRAETWYGNKRGSIGNGKVIAPQPWLNWDLWQGPAPRRDYHDNYVHYNWHWFWHWGTGELCNNAAHELDIARWALGVTTPERVSVSGGRYFHTDDDWEMYDTLTATYDFGDKGTIVWNGDSCNNLKRFGRGRGTLIMGTEGRAVVSRAGYELYDLKGNLVKEASSKRKTATATADTRGGGGLTDRHTRNFRDQVTGKTNVAAAPVTEGHASTMLCHLGNIAYRTGEDVVISKKTGRAKNKAARKLWSREFERGWEMKV